MSSEPLQYDSPLYWSSIVLLVVVIFAAIFVVASFTQAGRLVIDSTRMKLRHLTHSEGRILLTEDGHDEETRTE